MFENAILAPLDAANLQSHGLLGPGSSTGSRRIHKRRLNRSSEEEYRDIPLDVPLQSPAAHDAFALIPAVLISQETLTYLGLSETKAAELWNRWTNWPASGPRRETDADDGGFVVTFIDFITGSFENQTDTSADDDLHWRACMNSCGVAVDVQDAIMDPPFKDLRLSESCLFWIKDTIEMRYAGLKDIQRASLMRELGLRRAASHPNGHEGGGSRVGQSLGTGSSSSAPQGQRSVSGTQQQSTPGIEADSWGSASAIAARNAPGHTVLFKGVDQARIAGLFDETGAVDRIETLLSSPPSDFSGTRSLFYFTPDYQVAQYYASYAKRRANCESVVIVCLRIPHAAIESLSPPLLQHVYWPSSEWKELIWRCRTRRSLSSHLRKYREAVLIIGTTSRKPELVYHGMGSWEDVTEDCLLRVGTSGALAVEYVFSGEEDGREFLMNHGARSLRVFPYPRSDLERWLAENH